MNATNNGHPHTESLCPDLDALGQGYLPPSLAERGLERLLALWAWQKAVRQGRPPGTLQERARAYIAHIPPAVSGQGGHNATFHVACVLIKGFGLPVEEALETIRDWNQTCQPPWSEKELRHKLADAAKRPGPVGELAGCTPPEIHSPYPPYIRGSRENESSGQPEPAFPPPIPASQLPSGGSETSWLWEGVISRGGITLLSALWKSGKTTLLASMLKAMEQGGVFCGRQIATGRVLVVTEESALRWADRRDRLGLKDHIEFIVRPFMGKPKWETWGAFLLYLVGLVQESRYDLVVFDPLVNLWPVKDENDAAQVTSALMPLHRVADRASILLVHHNRKGDGTEATASRGSGALTAFVDTIIELRRYAPDDQTDRRRVLTGYGRDDDTVQELVVELDEQGNYATHGTRTEVRSRQIAEVLRELLPTVPPGTTFNDLLDSWPEGERKPNRTKCFNALKEAVDRGLFARQGQGVRGDPHTYWLPVEGGPQPSANGEL